jgi:putative hydrolase of the HAD superfamily
VNPFLQHIQLITFDLDDTLYPEINFVKSGFIAVSHVIKKRYNINIDVYKILWNLFILGERKTTFNRAFSSLGLGDNNALIEEMVHVYRQHKPNITLYPDALDILMTFHKKKSIGLLTDGNVITQQNKVNALKIEKYFDLIVFTDEGGVNAWKPSPWGYKKMMQHFLLQGRQCAYVGDNSLKDFTGARKLGWITFKIVREEGLYRDAVDSKINDADYTLKSLTELKDIIF